MKAYKVFLFVLCFSNVLCQIEDTPPNINDVFSLAPSFSYVSEDTNWYRIDQEYNLSRNQYSGWVYRDGFQEGDYYYLLEYGSGHFNNPPLHDGVMLSKIKLQNGNVEWTHRSNYYAGNTHLYSPVLGFLKNTNDEYVEVFNSRSQDDIETIQECPVFICDIHSNVSKQVINKQTGAFLSETTYADSLRIIANLDQGVPFREVRGEKLLKHYIVNAIDDGKLKAFLNFYEVGENGLTTEDPIFIYEYDTGWMTQLLSFAYPSYYHQITPDVGVAMFGKINPVVGEQTIELKLVYFDTSDLPNISVINEFSVLDEVPEDQDEETGSVFMRPVENGVVLTQKAQIGGEQKVWAAWYDLDGQLITKIDAVEPNGEPIDILDGVTIYNDDLYVLTVKREINDTDIDEFSIIRYTREGESELVGQFSTTEEHKDVVTRFWNFEILENGDVLLYVRLVYPSALSEFETNATYLIKYDSSVFGISNTEEETIELVVQIYPNPTHDIFELKLDTNTDDYEWKVFDMVGRDVSSNVTVSRGSFNIEDLQAGTYNVMITIDGKIMNRRVIKI